MVLSEHHSQDFSTIGNHALLCVELASWEPKSRPPPSHHPRTPCHQRKRCSCCASTCVSPVVKYPAVVIAAAGLLASWTLSDADVPPSIGLHVLCELCRVSHVDLVRCAHNLERPTSADGLVA